MMFKLLLKSRLGRKLLAIVSLVLVVLIGLPVMALASITNLSALGLDSGGGYGSNYTGVWVYSDPQVAGDDYAYGNCTYWAALRRMQIGEPIPNTWGNANTWDDQSKKDGYIVDHIPMPGAIMQTDAGELGHVMFVESVNPDGSWVISEMNAVGFDEVDQRSFQPQAATAYKFIHDRPAI